MKIWSKISISFIVTFMVVISLVAAFVGIYSTNLVKGNIYSYLQSNNQARAEHVQTFIRDQKVTATILAAASVYRDFLKEPVKGPGYLNLKNKIDQRFVRTLEADPQINEVFILDRNGKVIASSDSLQVGLDKAQDEYFLKGKEGVYIKDLYYSEIIKKINYTISAPVKDEDGTLLGVSVLRYLPKDLSNIVEYSGSLGQTEENFLINKDKFFITPSTFLGGDVILKQKVETKNSTNCFESDKVDYITQNGYGGLIKKFGLQVVEDLDYRGVLVMATNSYIPETGWCLITKVDYYEMMAFRVTMTVYNSLIIIGAIIIFSAMGYWISRKITKPLKNLQLAVEDINHGDYSAQVWVENKDEIGALATSFNKMASEVQSSRADIEKKVEEQTKELREKALESNNQRVAILNVLEDVEIEKKKVETLAQDLEKFKLALDNASDQVVITDPEGIVIYGNQAVETITGYKAIEIIGKKAGSLWSVPMPLSYYKNMWNVIKDKKRTFVGEIQNKRKNGVFYTANISISPVLSNEGEVLYFVGIEHDITKEKEVDKAKTEFVSLASHQLRTPLSSINWYTEMLLNGDAGAINDGQKGYLEEVYNGSQRMVELVNSLLNVSRLDLGTFVINPTQVDVPKLVKSLCEELKSQIILKKQIIRENYSPDLPLFIADASLLRMVLQNLLSNAVKYTSIGGTITIELKVVPKGSDSAQRKIEADSYAIKVSDSGMGIPKAQQDKVFSKLFRADNAKQSETEGTGLGLYIIKSIVDQAGGEVWFESEENKGTAFYVYFPLSGMKKKEGTKQLDL